MRRKTDNVGSFKIEYLSNSLLTDSLQFFKAIFIRHINLKFDMDIPATA